MSREFRNLELKARGLFKGKRGVRKLDRYYDRLGSRANSNMFDGGGQLRASSRWGAVNEVAPRSGGLSRIEIARDYLNRRSQR